MESRVKHGLVFVGLLALLSGCSKTASTKEAAPASAEQKTEAPVAAKPVPDQLPDVLARINGETVTKAEFEQAVAQLEQRAGRSVPAEQRNQVYRDVLDQLIGFKLLSQEAKARKIEVPAAELEERMNAVKGHFGTPAEFEKALAAQNVTPDKFKEQTLGEIRMGKMMEAEVETKVSVGPADLDDFYKKNPDQFKQPERVRASHILLQVAADADAKKKADVKAKAEGILKKIKAGGDFAELAKKNSEDPGNAPAGGDLGYFTKGQMVGAFERVAFELKPGAVSELVETPFGFHIIKVVDKQDGKTLTLDEVRPQLEQFLKQRQREEKTLAFVKSLKTKGKVEILI